MRFRCILGRWWKKKRSVKQCTPAYKNKKKTVFFGRTLMKVHFWIILVSGYDLKEFYNKIVFLINFDKFVRRLFFFLLFFVPAYESFFFMAPVMLSNVQKRWKFVYEIWMYFGLVVKKKKHAWNSAPPPRKTKKNGYFCW